MIHTLRRSDDPRVAIHCSMAASTLAGLNAGFTGLRAANVVDGIARVVLGPLTAALNIAVEVNGPTRVLFGWPLFLGAAVVLGPCMAACRRKAGAYCPG
ncbi:MAG: hypothetical protein EXR66_05165 [Dehalococcoidia bacterium]|nr:hypothetical protein [Dehalococcoidia bacterium]